MKPRGRRFRSRSSEGEGRLGGEADRSREREARERHGVYDPAVGVEADAPHVGQREPAFEGIEEPELLSWPHLLERQAAEGEGMEVVELDAVLGFAGEHAVEVEGQPRPLGLFEVLVEHHGEEPHPGKDRFDRELLAGFADRAGGERLVGELELPSRRDALVGAVSVALQPEPHGAAPSRPEQARDLDAAQQFLDAHRTPLAPRAYGRPRGSVNLLTFFGRSTTLSAL
mgnify:FL=1